MRRIWPLSLLLIAVPVLALAQPSIVSVVPDTGTRGSTVEVQITGSETLFLQDSEVTSIVWLSQGAARIDASAVDVTSATLLDATFNIPIGATPGLYDVNVEQVDSTVVTLANGFTILSACAISDLAAGIQTPCSPATNTYTQQVIVTFADPPATGSLVVNGQSFTIGTSPQTVTLVDLVANGAAVNVTANFSDSPACSRTETALFTAPASCETAPCSISDLAAGTQTTCNPATNTYTQQVVVTYANPPATGNLVVNGQSFAIGTSPQTVTLIDLAANGLAVNVTASFSAEPGCSRNETALFTAPVSCGVSPCSISDLAAGTQTTCNPATNTYTQQVVVTYANPPATGNLVVNGQSFAIGTSPQTVTLVDLAANGLAVNVTASFSAEPGCSRNETALFTAPTSCSVSACGITDLAAGTQTPCDSTTNEYTQVVIVTFANPPATGSLVVNGQSFAIGTSPQSVTLTGLTANGDPVNVTASFSADAGCDRTETALFTAPVACGETGGLDCSDAEPSRKTLWPPNHRYHNIRIEDVESSGKGDVDITINRVTSDEPTNGRGDGNTCPDAVIRDNGTVDLRAERSDRGNGRVYTIHFTATDGTGASCTDSVYVCVPLNRGNDDDDDDDDDKRVLPGTAEDPSVADGDRRRRRDRDCDRDRDRDRDRDDDKRGDRDHRRRDRCRDERCNRDEVQYDATACDDDKVTLSAPETASRPLIAWQSSDGLMVRFTAKAAGPVVVKIYDLRGRLVRDLATRDFQAGQHSLQWDGQDASGHATASGVYLVRVVTGGESHTTKAIWMR